MAPTPINTANEWVSKMSELSTFIEQYPLRPNFTKWEWTAPTTKIDGRAALEVLIFLSEKIKVVLPSLTAISASSLIFSIRFFKESFISNVQSKILTFFLKNDLNFLNCELVRTGLSKTYIFSSVRLSKSRMFPKFPKSCFKTHNFIFS